jgi:hypothetical protein
LATYSLQFAKANAATLLQQEKSNSEDLQRGRVNISGFICTAASQSSRRRTFDEFLSMAVALRRALHHCCMFVPLAPAAHNLGVVLRRPCRGQVCSGMPGAMARIAPPQPDEAMARIAPRFFVPQPKGKQKRMLVTSYE